MDILYVLQIQIYQTQFLRTYYRCYIVVLNETINDNWVAGFSAKLYGIHIGQVLCAELWALLYCLKLALSVNIDSVISKIML